MTLAQARERWMDLLTRLEANKDAGYLELQVVVCQTLEEANELMDQEWND